MSDRNATRAVALGICLLFVTACGPEQILEPAGAGGQPAAVQPMFLVTDRVLSSDPADRGARADVVSRALLDVGIPPIHVEGRVEYAAGSADPARSFTLLRSKGLSSEAEFLDAVASSPNPGEEVTVFVHGYYNTIGSAVYRHAQIAHDFGLEGPQVTFAWPSAADPRGYVYDRDSIDIARDDLEALLVGLAQGDRPIALVGHSMGAQLITETLRQMSIGDESWVLDHLSAVMLISPDIDVDLFRSQVERIDPLPEPFVVFLSQQDRVLGLSARLTNQRERLGSTSDTALLTSLGVYVVDLTALSGQGGNGHLLAVSSPAAIAIGRGLRRSGADLAQSGPTVFDAADVFVQGAFRPLQIP